MKMKLRWKWNLSKRLSPKIYSYTVYTLTQVQKDKDFQFWQLENLRKEFCPPPLFILRKNPNYLVYSMQAYYYSSENFPASTIIPVTLIILDPRAICIFGGEWRVPEGSILGPLVLNDLTENLRSNPKLFANDDSLFTIISGQNEAAKQLCADLDKTIIISAIATMQCCKNALKRCKNAL